MMKTKGGLNYTMSKYTYCYDVGPPLFGEKISAVVEIRDMFARLIGEKDDNNPIADFAMFKAALWIFDVLQRHKKELLDVNSSSLFFIDWKQFKRMSPEGNVIIWKRHWQIHS